MSKCLWCQDREKVGYKYCKECKKEVLKFHDANHQKKKRAEAWKICTECGVAKTRTKYCRSCAQWVRNRNSKEAMARKYKAKSGGRGGSKSEIKVDPKWLVRGAISNNRRGAFYDQ